MDPEEVKRRIEAARVLRGLSQTEMEALGHAEGLDRQELGRLERGKLGMTNVRRDVLCRVLGVPQRWFSAEDLDDVVGLNDEKNATALEVLREMLRTLGLEPPPPPEEPS